MREENSHGGEIKFYWSGLLMEVDQALLTTLPGHTQKAKPACLRCLPIA